MKQILSNKPIFLIVAGLSCNSACVMCSVKSHGKNCHNGTTKEIIKDLIKGRKENYERMEFTGGEPTIRKDIFLLIKQARNLGYKEIGINTNGILLGNKSFYDKLVKAGLTNITFSLHAHNKKLNETITRTPDSFEQTVAGIKNALNYKNLTISVVTVILKLNYQHIFPIGKFIHSLGVSIWDITDLIPDGYGKESYKALCVKRAELSDALNSLMPLLDNSQAITFFAFSPCIFPPGVLNSKSINWVTALGKLEVEKPITYDQKNLPTDYVGKNFGTQQKKLDICQNCIFTEKCAGIWIEYLRLYGDEEIRKLAIKHGCIKRNFEFY